MAVIQVSRIQHRSGEAKDLPENLAQSEFGVAIDTGQVFIGAPQFAPIANRTKFPYRNIRLLTEFDTQYTLTGETYYHGSLQSFNLTSSTVTQTVTTLMTYPELAYGHYDYSITSLDSSGARRMGHFMVMTDGNNIKLQDTGVELVTGTPTSVTLGLTLIGGTTLNLLAANLGGREYVLQLSGRQWAGPVIPE